MTIGDLGVNKPPEEDFSQNLRGAEPGKFRLLERCLEVSRPHYLFFYGRRLQPQLPGRVLSKQTTRMARVLGRIESRPFRELLHHPGWAQIEHNPQEAVLAEADEERLIN